MALQQTDEGTIWIWVPENEDKGFNFIDLKEAEYIFENMDPPIKTSTINTIIKTADEQLN